MVGISGRGQQGSWWWRRSGLGDIRVICLAPGYKKYDLHAVQMMGANIELWQYRLYESGALYLEEIYIKSLVGAVEPSNGATVKDPVTVAAGRKRRSPRRTASYTVEQHFDGVDESLAVLANDLRDFIMNLDESVGEAPKKYYIAYKLTQNFVCMEIKKSKVLLYLKLDPGQVGELPRNARDVREIGHYGTGDLEVTVTSADDVDSAQALVRLAFERVGG